MRSAVLAAAFPNLGIGFAGVALAFGLTLLTMAFTIGPISGCHINPAVSIGLVVGKRFPVSELLPYVVAQVLGAMVGSATLYVIANGKEGFGLAGGFASNGYGIHSPGGYSLLACFVAEVVLTLFFLLVIFGSTDDRAPKGFAPIAIGLCLTLIHLILFLSRILPSTQREARGLQFSWEGGLSPNYGCSGLPRSSAPHWLASFTPSSSRRASRRQFVPLRGLTENNSPHVWSFSPRQRPAVLVRRTGGPIILPRRVCAPTGTNGPSGCDWI